MVFRLIIFLFIGIFCLPFYASSQNSESKSTTVKEEKTFKKVVLKQQRYIEKRTKGCGYTVYVDSLEIVSVHFLKSKELTMRVSIYNSRTCLVTNIYYYKGNPIYELIPTEGYYIELFFANGDLIYCDKKTMIANSKASPDIFSINKKNEVPKIIFIRDKIKSDFL